MFKVVFDTNVYVSAFLTHGGKAEKAYLLAVGNKFELYASVAILTETAKKLREKFLWEDDKITDALKHISKTAVVLKPAIRMNILKDAPDNRVLECAKQAGAQLIVTGDKHLLDLEEFEGIGIVRVADFIRTFSSRV